MPDPGPIDFDDLLKAVASAFEVPVKQLTTRGRHHYWPRFAAIWLCRNFLHETLRDIGERFGGVTAATVSQSLAQVETLIVEQPEFAGAVEVASSAILSGMSAK